MPVLIQQCFFPDVPFIHPTAASPTESHVQVDRTPKCKLQLTPEGFSLPFWWGKTFPEPIQQVHVSDIQQTLTEYHSEQNAFTLHLYQGNLGVLIREAENLSSSKKKNQENRVWHDPLHKKMGNLIAILEHIQNRDLAHAPFSNTCELCHRLRWDGIQSNACTTRSKGLLVGIQDFDCHCSESKTVLMCNLLMHVQLYNGIFNIYTVMNAPADLRCRTT